MRDGTPVATDGDHVPELHLEERETNDLIDRMPVDISAFLRIVYPWRARICALLSVNRQTFNERINVCHRILGRMLDQRRRGEELDADRRRPRHRVKSIAVRNQKGRRVVVAAVQVEK